MRILAVDKKHEKEITDWLVDVKKGQSGLRQLLSEQTPIQLKPLSPEQ